MRAIRAAAGLSLQDMARRTGHSASFLSRVERGERACPPDLPAAYKARFGTIDGGANQATSRQTARIAETYVEEVQLTVVLLPGGGCDYYDEQWTFRARRDGLHQLSLMEDRAEEVRLWSFDVLSGGDLAFEQHQDNWLAVRLQFPPLKAGQRHEFTVREFPPSDLDTLTFFVMSGHDIRQLRFTVVVPPDARVAYSLLRIDRLSPDLDSIPLDICWPVARTFPETEVLFEAPEQGVSYGIHWDW